MIFASPTQPFFEQEGRESRANVHPALVDQLQSGGSMIAAVRAKLQRKAEAPRRRFAGQRLVDHGWRAPHGVAATRPAGAGVSVGLGRVVVISSRCCARGSARSRAVFHTTVK